MLNTTKKSQGFSIIMAMFILVVLSLLAVAMLSIMAAGADSVAREVLSSRALMAAESGAQRQLTDIFPLGGATNLGACQLSTPYTFGGLSGCSNASVVVSCTSVNVSAVNYFTITSTGRCGPTGDQAVRIVEVQAKDTI